MILVIIAIALAVGFAGYFMYHESKRNSHVGSIVNWWLYFGN